MGTCYWQKVYVHSEGAPSLSFSSHESTTLDLWLQVLYILKFKLHNIKNNIDVMEIVVTLDYNTNTIGLNNPTWLRIIIKYYVSRLCGLILWVFGNK